MRTSTILLIVFNLITFNVGLVALYTKINKSPEQPVFVEPLPTVPESEIVVPVEKPVNYTLTDPRPAYMNYNQTVDRLRQWNTEAPDLTEVFKYGKSTAGSDLFGIRVTRKSIVADEPRVLITACIHGNEPLSSSTVMWYIAQLLDRYGDDEEVTSLLDSRDIYFVPVLSPDSYPNSRAVDGVDPNRNFPNPNNPSLQSVAPVAAIQSLFHKIKPKAVISGHTWGRVYLTPWGDSMTKCPNHADYERIVGAMAKLSDYRWMRACDLYTQNGGLNIRPPIRTSFAPIYGGELDWYYRNGAFSIVCEFGLHQKIPSNRDTNNEFVRTWKGFIHFVKEAPLVEIYTTTLKRAA